MNILTLDTCKSTNLEARKILDSGFVLEPVVITARKQTQGKGRSGNWFSPEDCGIYMSVITSELEAADTRLIGNRLVNLLKEYFKLRVYRSGINDIGLAGRKLAGILCEYHTASNKVIVGVGLNTFRPSNNKIRKDLIKKAVWLNEFSAESLIDHRILVNMITEEIIKI